MKKELLKKLAELKKQYGDVDGIVLTREAFHACHPDKPHGWKCNAIKLDGDTAITGWIWWDFESWIDENGEIDDASSYPWDIATAEDFEEFETLDLADQDEIKDLLKQL